MSTPTPRQLKSREDVLKFWMRGRMINQATKERGQTLADWYLENRPSENRDQIYKMAEFAAKIKKLAELEKLLAVGPQGRAKDEEGRPLTWEHFIVLMRVPKEKRLELATTASKERLSPKEMRARAFPPPVKEKRGRKPAEPTSPEAVLRTVSRHLTIELKRLKWVTDPKEILKFQDVQQLLSDVHTIVDKALVTTSKQKSEFQRLQSLLKDLHTIANKALKLKS